MPTDVTNKEEVDELIKIAQQTFGGLDIVINSAGQMLSSKITDYQVDEWDSMIDVNIKGTFIYGTGCITNYVRTIKWPSY